MKIKKTFVGMASFLVMLLAWPQMPSMAQEVPAHAITNVTIHMADGATLENADIVWRNGVIEQIGVNESIPFDAFIIDGGDSLHVYPGLIDGMATWGSPETPRDLPRLENPGKPPYDRAGAQPQRVPEHYLNEDKAFEAAMKAGFTLVALGLDGQMLPGHIQPFNLSASKLTQAHVFANPLALQGSFETAPGGWGSGAYPSTQMGVMAYFRQLMYDATALQEHMMYFEKHSEMTQPEQNDVLEALFPLVNKEYPLYFEVDSKEEIERLFRLQDEFGFDVVLVSAKEAYQEAALLEPEQKEIWLDWSMIYFDQGDYSRAIELINNGLEENPDDSDLLYRMVVFQITAGHYKEAFTFLENALILDFDNHEVLFEFFPKLETQKALFKIIDQFRKED